MKCISVIFGTVGLFYLMFSQLFCSNGKYLEPSDLFNMAFEDLLNVKVATGNLTGIENIKTPVSITTITRSDIELTPARDLYDLIETYVPGAIWMNHHDSPKLGLRGIISDRNTKFLLLVNGKNMNNKARNGATTELENRDLSDIEKIEVIRGPGSVTYGPGAVAGVINITTKSGKADDGFDANAQYYYPYCSVGGNISYSRKFDDFDFYAFGSMISTHGWSNTKAILIQGTNSFGFIQPGNLFKNSAQDYFADYNDIPQLKLYTEVNFLKEFNFFARYTSSGGSEYGAFPKYQAMTGFDSTGNPILGSPVNFVQNRYQQYIVSLKNLHNFENLLDLESSVSWGSQNIIRRQDYIQVMSEQFAPPDSILKQLEDINSLRNKYVYFAEDELNFRLLARREFKTNFVAALGVEFAYNHWGNPWGESDRNFRMGDYGNIISGPDSYCYGYPSNFGVTDSTGYWVGNGWSTNTYSIFGELNWQFTNSFTLLLSARGDKNSFSDYLFSPRAALIYEIDKSNFFKLVAQKSQRMNTAEELFLQHEAGKISSPETLNSIELIFSRLQSQNLFFSSSVYYNNLDVLSWSDPNRTTRNTGNLSLLGLELETKFKSKNLNFGISHSFIKQLRWKLADSIFQSGVSYSDYFLQLDSTQLNGVGNSINNWSNNSTKIFATLMMFDGRILLHADARIFWNFEGAKDGIQMIKNAMVGNPDSAKFAKMIDLINSEHIYDTNFRLNVSIQYNFFKNLSATLYVQNLLGLNHNIRYTYEAGNKTQDAILRTGLVEEPLTIGFKLSANLF